MTIHTHPWGEHNSWPLRYRLGPSGADGDLANSLPSIHHVIMGSNARGGWMYHYYGPRSLSGIK